MLFFLEYFPSFATAFLVLFCNFNDESKPVVTFTWLVVARILNVVFVLLLFSLMLGGVSFVLNLTAENAESARSLRGHYLCAFLITSTLLHLKGKYISKQDAKNT